MKLSLRAKFLILSGLVQALVVCLLIWNSLRLLDDAINQNTYRVAREYAMTLNLSVSPYAGNGRLDDLQPFLSEMLSSPKDSFVRYLVIMDSQEKVIFKIGQAPKNLLALYKDPGKNAAVNGLTTLLSGSVMHAKAPFLLKDAEVGSLNFGLSTEDLILARQEVLQQGGAISIFGFLLGLLLLYLFTLGIGRRLHALTKQSVRLSRGEFDSLLPEKGGDEIEVYSRSLNTMSLALRDRIMQLETSERRLVESEIRFKTLFDLAPVPLTVTDRRGTPVGINLALTRVFGYADGDVIGKVSGQFDFWDSFAERDRIWTAFRQNGALQGEIARARRADGRSVELAIWASSLSLGGEHSIIWALLDLTEELNAKRDLKELNASLEERVRQRASELEMANNDLSRTLETLKRAQSDLIVAEKMASLGSLVAGVAHELNTPIGNALLAATALSDQVSVFQTVVSSGAIGRSVLIEHLAQTSLACMLMARSLQKAASLITSFKQVAADQTSDQRRIFDLRLVVHDTIATFTPLLRSKNCIATVDVPTLALDSYPGSLCQVIDNLINNALIHAFEGREASAIRLHARETDAETVELTFADDGAGMQPEVLHHVFDPFFTTRMGQGGTGLGMNIVYNIVTGVLGGRIGIESAPGQGTCIRITMPRQAPLSEILERKI